MNIYNKRGGYAAQLKPHSLSLFIAMRLKKRCHLNAFALTPAIFLDRLHFLCSRSLFYLEQDWHLKNKVRYIGSVCLHIHSNTLFLQRLQ